MQNYRKTIVHVAKQDIEQMKEASTWSRIQDDVPIVAFIFGRTEAEVYADVKKEIRRQMLEKQKSHREY